MDPVQSWLDAEEVRRMAESLMAPPPKINPSALEAGYGDNFEGFASDHLPPPSAPRQSQPIDGRPHAQRVPSPPQASQFPQAAPVSPPQPTAADDASRRTAVGDVLADARRVAEGSGMLRNGTDQDLSSNDQVQAPPVTPKPEFKPEVVKSPVPSAPNVRKTDPSTSRGPFLARLQHFSATLGRELDAQAMFLIDNEGQILLDEVENPKLIQVARTLANASYTASRQTAGSAAIGNLHVKIGASATLEVVPVRSRYGLLILGVIFPAPLGAERVQQVAELLYKTVEPTEKSEPLT